MFNRSKALSAQVIVITGASSGIGLATARMAAEKGAKLVLVARNEEALTQITTEINGNGGEAIYVTADVANRDDVERVANEAIDRFGTIDTWVNNAGVGLIGRLEEIAEEDHRRLFDTNFWGLVNGSLVAAKHMKTNGGTIVNLGSEVSEIGLPLQGMYAASKHAIKGFTDAFRIELMQDNAPIHVTLIKPAAIGTPFFEHAKNYTGQEPKAPAPVYAAEEVAYAILKSATKPVREIFVGGGGKITAGFVAHAPRLFDWLGKTAGKSMVLSDQPQTHRNDNMYQPGDDGNVRGEIAPAGRTSTYTRMALNPMATSAALALIGAGVYGLYRGCQPKSGMDRAYDRLDWARKTAANVTHDMRKRIGY